ncbi:FadR/GntR family transcriptional regulator [Amycolatopsis vancoresmycina]|uniref:GntR family transcriptional regulator n=1 Tax=Amycolatopsis vancoresmycina DSM 44592 TaxID=1292037 RepID=R1HM79_9PSEU|nr:FadR/GntR family transcriptional regulator [Amycolatopsis vancoresmycina]EOD59479.1 GntR family transcriptional regulator [Amycolatopsis vancoresmycina DSM 44592]
MSTAAFPPPDAPYPRGRRADAVVDHLIELIASGVLRPDQLLPVESALCETFGVSRTVVREAIKSLEAKGLVKARQGVGTLVSAQESWNLLDPALLAAIVRHDRRYDILDQLIAVRTSLESSMAREAARRATPEDVAELRELMTRLDAAVGEPDLLDDIDVAFHERIMLVSGNRLGRAIVHTVHAEARRSPRYVGHSALKHRRQSNRQHLAVFEAIEAGDPDAAGALMAEHIATSWQRRRPAG